MEKEKIIEILKPFIEFADERVTGSLASDDHIVYQYNKKSFTIGDLKRLLYIAVELSEVKDCINCPSNQFYLANTAKIMDTEELNSEVKESMTDEEILNAFEREWYAKEQQPIQGKIEESKLSSGWQQCPKCYGQGLVWFPPNQPMTETFAGDGKPYECGVCKGKKIISIETGQPPDASQGKELREELIRFSNYLWLHSLTNPSEITVNEYLKTR